MDPELQFSDVHPFAEVRSVAIAIRGDADLRHIGILYDSFEDGELWLVHLCGHCELRIDPPSDDYAWVGFHTYDEWEAAQLASHVGLVALANEAEGIPFGLDFEPAGFDDNTGCWLLGSGEVGLTCATFVASVFARFGFPVVDPAQWPIRAEDQPVQDTLVDALESRNVSTAYVESQRNKIGLMARFRPEEVAASCASPDKPLNHRDAIPRGTKLLKQLLDGNGARAASR